MPEARYRIEIHVHAARDLRSLDDRTRAKIRKKIDSLAHDPRPQGCRKLRGSENTYRIRIGDHRVLYQIEDAVVLVVVVRVGHRREVY